MHQTTAFLKSLSTNRTCPNLEKKKEEKKKAFSGQKVLLDIPGREYNSIWTIRKWGLSVFLLFLSEAFFLKWVHNCSKMCCLLKGKPNKPSFHDYIFFHSTIPICMACATLSQREPGMLITNSQVEPYVIIWTTDNVQKFKHIFLAHLSIGLKTYVI